MIPTSPLAPTISLSMAFVLEFLGLKPGQFRIEGQGPFETEVGWKAGLYDLRTDAEGFDTIIVERRWWTVDGATLVVAQNVDPEIFIRNLHGWELEYWGIDIPGRLISEAESWLRGQRAQALSPYREEVEGWCRELQREETFPYLPLKLQGEVKNVPCNITGDLEPLVKELEAEWPRAELRREQTQRGDRLFHFGGRYRETGATGNAQYWVVRPDGSLREADEVAPLNHFRPSQGGTKFFWEVHPDELALQWGKAMTREPHEFRVAWMPPELTPAQTATAEKLQHEITERFVGTHGMSGDPSPSIGDGWGLGGDKVSFAPTTPPPVPKPSAPEPPPATPAASAPKPYTVEDLSAKFGPRRR